jgi:hypothetical protein
MSVVDPQGRRRFASAGAREQLQIITPNAYWSLAAVAIPSRACSGLAYSGDPADRRPPPRPDRAVDGDPEVAQVRVAGLVDSTFAGFTSRCVTPAA